MTNYQKSMEDMFTKSGKQHQLFFNIKVILLIIIIIIMEFPFGTDKTIQANRPDIVIKHKQYKVFHLIDMSVLSDSNISVKEFEKLSKYKDLETGNANMWKLETKTIAFIVETLSMITKGTQKC